MILQIADCLDAATLAAVREAGAALEFEGGERTAGWAARDVKDNLQASGRPELRGLLETVEARVRDNALFQAAARPKRLLRLTLSRYDPGMAYGSHVDNAVIEGERTDLSFTLFLSEPDDYSGGELVLEDASGERAWKLPAGALLLYPSTYLHHVRPVGEGSRLAVVGWVRSRVHDSARREILFDLERSMRAEHAERGKSAQFDRLSKTLNNLVRMWSD